MTRFQALGFRHLLAVAVVSATVTSQAEVPLEFNPGSVHQLTANVEGDGFAFKTLGEDPFILLKPFPASAPQEEDHVLAFEYFCPDGINDLEVFFGPPIVAGASLSAGEMRRAESWQPFAVDLREASGGRWSSRLNLLRLDFGRRGGVELRVRNLRLRSPNAAERQSSAEREAIRQRKATAAAAVTGYLDAAMPSRIESVRVTLDEIIVSGTATSGAEGLRLVEAQPWQELWKLGRDLTLDQSFLMSSPRVAVEEGTFSVTIPRFDAQRDRLTSRWALAGPGPDQTTRLVSHFVYPTDLIGACAHPGLDRKTAAGIKGMAGVWANDILQELVELGVKHITDNVFLSGMFSDQARPGWESFNRNGRIWWVNPGAIAQHDRLIKFATDHDMVVSAILLVAFGDSGFEKLIQHPEAERAGHYAMPNLTTREGAEAYEAAIHYLAQRYAQPGDPHGRISNWILHNEVDYGWEWTNMGAQPQAVYLDTYVRSMRIIHALARQFNPHARAFISLTHSWNVPEDPAWKTYSPRGMLEQLAQYSRIEGDFEWGVAYHPYPQSLFHAAAWRDTLPADNFDTPLITPKNIAVLDRWMQRPEMRFQGRPRGVILSEQGFHTPDYSDSGQQLQAAAFVYMWRQLRGLESIEAFHNHRWVDHPHEGGLKLGLRSLPSEGKPYGDRKFAWEIYQALDTPVEAARTKFADEVIGGSAPK